MKVFVAGGTGAIGKQLVPQLVTAGHDVVATARSESPTSARPTEPTLVARDTVALTNDGRPQRPR